MNLQIILISLVLLFLFCSVCREMYKEYYNDLDMNNFQYYSEINSTMEPTIEPTTEPRLWSPDDSHLVCQPMSSRGNNGNKDEVHGFNQHTDTFAKILEKEKMDQEQK